MLNYVLNGRGFGDMASAFQGCNWDAGYYRPYFEEIGRGVAPRSIPCVTIKTGRQKTDADGKIVRNSHGQALMETEQVRIKDLVDNGHPMIPVWNATVLRKDEWIMLDKAMIEVQRARLRAWADLAASATFTLDGMSKTMLEHQTMSDSGSAVVDMFGETEGRTDRPLFGLQGMPLPMTHSGFTFYDREIQVSRNGGSPLNDIGARHATRKVSEQIEKTTIGIVQGIQYGTSTNYGATSKVYGYKNFGSRNTLTSMTTPDGTNGTTVFTKWLDLRQTLYDDNFHGPFMCYTSKDYDEFLDNLFSTTEPSAGTLRSRLLQVPDFKSITSLDYLTDKFTVLMIQMDAMVARAVIGMPMQTIQWDTRGGAQKNFRVVAIMAPQLFADYDGKCGIAHGTTS